MLQMECLFLEGNALCCAFVKNTLKIIYKINDVYFENFTLKKYKHAFVCGNHTTILVKNLQESSVFLKKTFRNSKQKVHLMQNVNRNTNYSLQFAEMLR